MNYEAQAGTTSADVAAILKAVSESQAATAATTAPVVTESLDLDAIYQATYEAEMAKYEAQHQLELAQAAAATQAENVQSVINYEQLGLTELTQQTMSSVNQGQLVPQDLTNINQLLENQNVSSNAYAGGSMTAGGFQMPTASEKEVVYKIVAAEGGSHNPQEARNILSTMINRAKTGRWGGQNLLTIATRPNQYVVYQTGRYKSAALTPESRAACDALLNTTASGMPADHVYQSFRSAGSTSYSKIQLVPGGNRYANPIA